MARLNQVNPRQLIFARQHPAAIDKGVFHNDVIAVSNRQVLFCHEQAFADQDAVLQQLAQQVPGFTPLVVPASRVTVEEAVATYLFNSQLLSRADGSMALILPQEAQAHPGVWNYLNELLAADNPIAALQVFDLRESMANGGGPACLRLPLVLPALPLADGQYRLALYAWLDGEWWTVLWGHLLWVVPWMLFILRPAWRQHDPRMTVIARTLGWGPTRIFWLLTLPSLTRPLLTALAVGFSVSIAQYLPTLWLGAGRIPTLTSQAVALSSGGEAQTLAAQALWQLLLPAVCFILTALLAWLAGRYRRGLR